MNAEDIINARLETAVENLSDPEILCLTDNHMWEYAYAARPDTHYNPYAVGALTTIETRTCKHCGKKETARCPE